ncbi:MULTISPECIES: dynamin family protein [Staphylococcus]|nr:MULTISPECIES: dynamin family protein [Staphylococcus]APR61017.1 dynamin family protein [Staphylococcus condimenti]MDK8644046.1 dynamin family protein [Staphylococcus condimenti]OFP01365.1 dynamin family protein [Staphylococcus sp. HMSC065E08]QRP96529.1 dynamin family protein [Staphylococcus condimenti]RZI03543.1 GTP-binding protein [Staphylococcus condimenti]
MSSTNQLDILYKLKKEVEKSNHEDLVHIINQVIKKVYLNQFTLTFVGHFSAGKSTLINLLLEQEILPSSPVPTTSNTAIVSVSDESEIIANLEGQKYTKLSDYEEVKQLNRQNGDVESVEIKFDSNKFNKGFTLQDTPGVDSNVSLHQASTEQFMFTSNIVFYTVDYNHVQSAMNFQFMKRLNHAGIPVVFVINQIDKHNDDELSFSEFKQNIDNAINEWDLDILRTFYVSKFDYPENQINELSDFLVYQDNHRESMEDYIKRITEFITDDQLSYIQSEMQDILSILDIEEAQFDQAYLNFQQNKSVSEEAQLLNDPEKLMNYLKYQRKKILDNAYLMPHEMREKIRVYLESRVKTFKVGGLFNKKKKTEEERQARLENVMSELQDLVNQQVRQPMREDMSFLTRFINQSSVSNAILNQHYEIPKTLISDLYQEQMSISNQYVLNFCDDVVKAIHNYVKKDSNPLLKDAVKYAESQNIEAEDESTDYSEYEKYIKLRELQESLETHNYQHYYIHLDDSLDKLIDRTEIKYTKEELEQPERKEKANKTTHNDKEENIDLSVIKKGIEIIEPVPLFQQTKDDLNAAIERMDQQIVKIGVFGTFSAGKSSLINALLGDNYLVSSPNPTTAATTELSYGDSSAITLKKEEQLLAELNQLVETQQFHFDNLNDFKDTDTTALKNSLKKEQLAFVNAVKSQLELYQDMLKDGLTHNINQDEVKKWSAEDAYAAFVETVHLKLPIDWLKNKIIVDSLGLYSNNQRHSNETEKILTSSDLILYVSYFNHSFTDNDKAFIEYMKEMNQLNENQTFKMIINAVDLAESQSDLDAVEDYVSDALEQVNMPADIYSVSSRRSLKEGDEGIDKLKESLDYFASVESKVVLQHQMKSQLEQISNSFAEMSEDFQNNRQEMEKRQSKIQEINQKGAIPETTLSTAKQHAYNEVEDQIYHLNERLKLQLFDEVRTVFNAQMTKNKDFEDEKRIAVKTYLEQIHARLYMEQTLIAERIKKFLNQQLEEQLAPVVKQLNQLHILIHPHFNIDMNKDEIDTLHIDFEQMYQSLPKKLSKKRLLQPKAQKEIQEDVTMNTVELLQDDINLLRQQLEQQVKLMGQTAEKQIKAISDEIHQQAEELLKVKLDTSLIKQIDSAHAELKSIL